VEVTRNLIEDAVAADSSHCMIAEAIKIAQPGAVKVSVDIATLRFSDPVKQLRYTYLTPQVAQVALLRFDEGILPDPYRFTLMGAHITAMRKSRPQTEERREKSRAALAKARLVARSGHTLDRVGGKTPPTMSHARRRGFGVRGLGRAPELRGVPAEMLNNAPDLSKP